MQKEKEKTHTLNLPQFQVRISVSQAVYWDGLLRVLRGWEKAQEASYKQEEGLRQSGKGGCKTREEVVVVEERDGLSSILGHVLQHPACGLYFFQKYHPALFVATNCSWKDAHCQESEVEQQKGSRQTSGWAGAPTSEIARSAQGGAGRRMMALMYRRGAPTSGIMMGVPGGAVRQVMALLVIWGQPFTPDLMVIFSWILEHVSPSMYRQGAPTSEITMGAPGGAVRRILALWVIRGQPFAPNLMVILSWILEHAPPRRADIGHRDARAGRGGACKSSDKAMIIARVGKARTGEESNRFAAGHGQPPNHPNPAAIRPKNPFFRPLRGTVRTLQLLACRSLKSSGNAPQKPIFPPAARHRTHTAAASLQAARSLKSSGIAPQKPIFLAAARRRTQAWATQDPVTRYTCAFKRVEGEIDKWEVVIFLESLQRGQTGDSGTFS
ncbi:hypothetical protein B0H16DRAFT_1468400 [Mycena metata]|uniref:Uncharacterized protein n=1 Tax=Mycena metata TaxID=1033252 RepID=A0AAD7I197_9AGAR|nr:hypothetical protein B0H16DRAFT_1468400 [Mycena metata]